MEYESLHIWLQLSNRRHWLSNYKLPEKARYACVKHFKKITKTSSRGFCSNTCCYSQQNSHFLKTSKDPERLGRNRPVILHFRASTEIIITLERLLE